MIAVGGKSMYFVYVVGRSDGLHKIGVTGHVLDRCEALSKLYPRHRPIRLVRSFDLGMDAPLIEKVAQWDMVSRGYAMQNMEWFDARGRTCTNAIRRAIRLIDEIGRDGWTRRRIKARSER